MIDLPSGWAGELVFLAGLLVLTGLTIGLQRWARVRLGWTPLTAILRACVQLAVVAAILSGVLATGWTVVLFVALRKLSNRS